MTCALRVTCKFYLHRSATIEVSIFCLAMNGTLGDFSYHLFCLSFVIFCSTFCGSFWDNHANITVVKKDSWWLFKILIRIFQPITRGTCKLVPSCNAQKIKTFSALHTLQKVDFKIIIILYLKFMIYEQLDYVGPLLLCGQDRGNSFSIISTLNFWRW